MTNPPVVERLESELAVSSRDALMATIADELGTVIVEAKRTVAEAASRFDPDLPATAFYVMRYVLLHGPCPAGDIVKHLVMDKSAVSRLVSCLRDSGHLTASPDPADGRVTLLAGTEKAEKRLAQVRQENRLLFQDRVVDWSEPELAVFAAALSRFNTDG